MAEDTINRYQGDAWINGLEFDFHAEETAVDTFAHGIKIAGEQFFDDPLGAPLIPNWNRVISAFPHFFEELKAAVEEDYERSEDNLTYEAKWKDDYLHRSGRDLSRRK
jgi:glucosyl-3-phosphoglycerate synthase